MPEITPISLRPFYAESDRARLADLTSEIYSYSGALNRVIPGIETRESIAVLLAGMNSYYSNLIEGVKTLPDDVEAALAPEFAKSASNTDKQKLTYAHIKVETELRNELKKNPNIYSAEFIQGLHHKFYKNLPDTFQFTETHSGKLLAINGGNLRDRGVTIAKHIPPPPEELPHILTAFNNYFSAPSWLRTEQLFLAAASHHRLTWIHPFLDGNGRISRLFSTACLIEAGVDGSGLWSMSRGLARNRENYYQYLARADQTEPYEQRYRLSEKGLGEFSIFFLETLLDQMQFMTDLLELPKITKRIEKHIMFEIDPPKHGPALAKFLKWLFIEGTMARGEVKNVTGLKDTAAREVINLAFKHKLIKSPSPKGILSMAFPARILDSYFPKLYL